MAEDEDLWKALLSSGEQLATDADYEHGYRRETRYDLERYVTFSIGNEIYGLPIDKIVEISLRFETTPVPRSSDFVTGIGNVRGQVMPVLDLGLRLSLGPINEGRMNRTLIVRQKNELYGLVVESVLEVVSLIPEELEAPPGGIGSTRADFIAALGRNNGNLIIILDLAEVLEERSFVLAPYRDAGGTIYESL